MTDTERLVKLEVDFGRLDVKLDERDKANKSLLEGIHDKLDEMKDEQVSHSKQDDVKFQDLYSNYGRLTGRVDSAHRDIGWIKKLGGAAVTAAWAVIGWLFFKK